MECQLLSEVFLINLRNWIGPLGKNVGGVFVGDARSYKQFASVLQAKVEVDQDGEEQDSRYVVKFHAQSIAEFL